MAAKKKKQTKKKKDTSAMDFIVDSLKRNPKAAYASIRERAEKAGLTIYPIMYGRAQALLGIVKSAPRGSKKATARRTKATRGRPAGSKTRTARSRTRRAGAGRAPIDAVQELVDSLRATARANDELRNTLIKIRDLIDRVI